MKVLLLVLVFGLSLKISISQNLIKEFPTAIIAGTDFSFFLTIESNDFFDKVNESQLKVNLERSDNEPIQIPSKIIFEKEKSRIQFICLIPSNIKASSPCISVDLPDQNRIKSAVFQLINFQEFISTKFISKSQNTIYKLYLGDPLIINLSPKDGQNISLLSEFNFNQMTVRIENFTVPFQIYQKTDKSIEIEYIIPKDKNLIGELTFELLYFSQVFPWITSALLETTINVCGHEPVYTETKTSVLYYDEKNYQNVKLAFNNLESIEKIKFKVENGKISLKGTVEDEIEKSNPYLVYNFEESAISCELMAINLTQQSVITIIYYYYRFSESNSTENQFTAILETDSLYFILQIPIDRKYNTKSFQIRSIENKNIYADDFKANIINPKLIFELQDACTVDKDFTIEFDNKQNLDIGLNREKQISFSPGSKTAQVSVYSQLPAGMHPLTLKNTVNENETYKGEFYIKEVPEIQSFKINGQDRKEINPYGRAASKNYLVTFEGNSLTNDIKVEVTNSDQSWQKEYSGRSIDGKRFEINISFEFMDKMKDDTLFFRLKRINLLGETVYYDVSKKLFVLLPKMQYPDLNSKNICSINGIKKGTFTEVGPYDNVQLYLNPDSIDKSFGPQALQIELNYFNSQGKLIKRVNFRDPINNQDYLLLSPHYISSLPYYQLNILKALNIESLKPYERIEISVQHSNAYYNSINYSREFQSKVFVKGTCMDRWGVTLTLPPILVALRNVKAKEYSNIEGDSIITFSGNKSISVQPLLANAGLGIKYKPRRAYDKNKLPSDLAFCLYFTGMDFLSSQSRQEQIDDISNSDFIGRGSLNISFLVEYSFINIEDNNLRIPLSAGLVWVLNPLDNGPALAPIFGVGINIPILNASNN